MGQPPFLGDGLGTVWNSAYWIAQRLEGCGSVRAPHPALARHPYRRQTGGEIELR